MADKLETNPKRILNITQEIGQKIHIYRESRKYTLLELGTYLALYWHTMKPETAQGIIGSFETNGPRVFLTKPTTIAQKNRTVEERFIDYITALGITRERIYEFVPEARSIPLNFQYISIVEPYRDEYRSLLKPLTSPEAFKHAQQLVRNGQSIDDAVERALAKQKEEEHVAASN